MSKKAFFAPPVAKSYRAPFGKGEWELHSKPDDGVPVKSSNPSPMQSPKQKDSPSSVEKKPERKKNLERIEKEKGYLSDAQFEEIVQSVLQKSPQECRGKLQERLMVPAEPAESQRSSRRETSEAFPTAQRSDRREETEVGRKEQRIEVKKQSRFGPRQDEKAASNHVGCPANRKGKAKETAPGDADLEEAPDQEEGGSGCTAWVQCSYPSCEKWRRLSSDIDPSALPEDWSCSQNPDLRYNSCSVPEETWSGSEDDMVYAVYFQGSIVWAKQYGYPWWPGIIEADPDIGEYFLFSSQADSLPSKYHVTFFGHSVTRAWISASLLKNYGEPPGEGNALAKARTRRSEKENLQAALDMAKEAERSSLQERIRRFGFHSRFQPKGSSQGCTVLKEQENTASRPRVQGTPEAEGGKKKKKKKNPATSRTDQEKVLRERSGVKPDANLKRAIDTKGGKKPQSGGLENAAPASKKCQPERSAPKAAAACPGSKRATGKQDRNQKDSCERNFPWKKKKKWKP